MCGLDERLRRAALMCLLLSFVVMQVEETLREYFTKIEV